MTDKTVLPEVLPPPTAIDPASPRARARRRLEALAQKAALAGAAGTLSACLGYGVVDEVPRPVQCTASQDVNTWLRGNVAAGATPSSLVLSLATGEGFPRVVGLTFSNFFTADHATITGTPKFDGKDLTSSTTVSVTLAVDQNATEVVVHTAISCEDVPRNIDINIDVASVSVTSIADAVTP